MRKNLFSLLAVVFAMALVPYITSAQTANIYIGSTDQTIRGFGGMNFPRWIGDLTTDQADKAFGNGNGQIGLSILRISVSPNSTQWNLEIATAQRAKSHGAIVFATPWSPPASMKTNNSTIQGSLRTDQYGAYANYLRDFANYMSSNGASLYAVSVQNEPDFLPDYESCGWTASQMRTFLDNNASVIPVRVIAPETVHYNSSWMSTLASASQLDILANHNYGGSPTRYNTSKEQWMTEHITDTEDANNMTLALNLGKEIHDFMINGYNAYIWWYIRRSYGLITENGSVSKRGFVMSHFSRFVRPGYVRVRADASPTSGVSISSYQSGNTLVIVAINQNSSSRSITLNFPDNNVTNITKWETTSGHNVSEISTYSGGTSLSNTLAGYSITTFRGTVGGSGGGGGTTVYYQLQNRATGLRLDGMGRTTNGDACGQYANTTHVNSNWELIDVGGGYYQLRNRGTGLYLDGMGRTTNGSDVGQWANTTHQNSHWSLQQYDGNYYRLQNRATGLFLDGMGRTSNGANCGQWANTTSQNAQWQLITVSSGSSSRVAFESPSQETIQESSVVLFYPNPVKETLTVQRDKDEIPAKARIFNVSGQLMLSADLAGTDNKVDVNALAQGVYFLEVTSPSGVTRSKLIKE